MRQIIFVMLFCFCSAACARMNITPISESAQKLDRAGKILVVTGADGRYESITYTGTGNEFASIVLVEFAKYASGYEILPQMSLANAIGEAKAKDAKYVVMPEILFYEDRNTPWSGRLDQITIKVTVYYVDDGSMVQSSLVTATNQWATLVNNRPMVLIYKPLAEVVKKFYQKIDLMPEPASINTGA